jgi:hypothetical protein
VARVTITIEDDALGSIAASVLFEPSLTKAQFAGEADLSDAQGAAAHLMEALMNMGDVQNMSVS